MATASGSPLRPHRVNQQPGFIRGWYGHDPKTCWDLIRWAEANPDLLQEGQTGDRLGPGIISTVKKTWDVNLLDNPVAQPYLDLLQQVCEAYISEFPCSNQYSPWALEYCNLQWHPPGGGFLNWHTERHSARAPVSHRHLVYMTYLNTVNQGGETEFLHQGLAIEPEQGLTLIWPADWTHTHRGRPCSQIKIIMTGSYVFR